MNFADLSLRQTCQALRNSEFTSVELTRWTLDQIKGSNDVLHAFIRPLPELAMALAQQADRDFADGIVRGPLQGIPFGVKDMFDMKGIPTTGHSTIGLDAIAREDAEIVSRMMSGGAIPVGKTATFEFATYGPDPDLPFPLARNPWGLDRFTGGSSSGSAVSIAAGILRMALGTDTGGSIRTPSSWCGTVGLKPTFGRVSRRGCFPLSRSLDHTGALARSVEDAAISLQAIAGFDPLDPDCANRPVDAYTRLLGQPVRGLRIGIAPPLLETASEDVRAGVKRITELLSQSGAEIIKVEMPSLGEFGAVVRALLIVEGHHVHATSMRFRFEDIGPLMARRLALAAGYTGLDYLACQKVRRVLAATVSKVLCQCDVILCATTPRTAPSGCAAPNPFDPTGPSMTNPFNVTGNPAISVPIGLDGEGLPLSVQLVGRLFDEAKLLQVAHVVEQGSGWLTQALPDWRTAQREDGHI